MIFYTINQLNNFLIAIFFGFIFGSIKNIFDVVYLLNSQKKIINILINTIFYTFFTCFFVFFINIFNFGLLNIVLLLSFILGFVWCKIVFKKTVVFCKNKWYNVLTNTHKLKKENHGNKSKKG